jgi:taurine dioxygenase
MAETHDLASQAETLQAPPFLGMKPGPRVAIRAEAERLDALQFDRIKVEPIGPTLGAEISGVDLATVDDASFEEIRRAWLEYKVIFFRDQNITAPEQMKFAQRFGELEEHPFLDASEDHEQVVRFEKGEDLSGYENLWHSDVSWRERPALASVLRSIEVPRCAGDTLFADMVTAYEGLDDDVKSRIEGLRAVHDFTHSFGRGLDPETLASRQKEFPAVSHPVVRTNPDTGRKILYVNAVFVSHIEDLEPAESERLLETLCRQATVPEYQCRFRWDRGSVAIWDNRSTQHYAASDYWPRRRVMERVAITGDRPA